MINRSHYIGHYKRNTEEQSKRSGLLEAGDC